MRFIAPIITYTTAILILSGFGRSGFCRANLQHRLYAANNNGPSSSPIISNVGYKISQDIIQPWNPVYNREISIFIDTLCGRYYLDLYVSTAIQEHGRTSSKKAPGDYLSPPAQWTKYNLFPLEKPEIEYLKGSLSAILSESYWHQGILNYLQEYGNVLDDSTRNEFYGRMTINDKKFALGGWLGKLTVAGVYDSYDGVAEFINKAKIYFQLPDIKPGDVKITTLGDRFFYSYLDRKGMFWLRGYNNYLDTPDHTKRVRWNVIELLKFYDEEFVP